jgi:uncharacterized cupin superfamily protein
MTAIELKEQGEGIYKIPPAEIVLEGSGASHLWEAARFSGDEINLGVWHGEPGRLIVRPRAHHEIFCVISGKIKLESKNGKILTLKSGQSAYIPCGWAGTWNTVVPTTKHYIIVTPADKGQAAQ